MSKLAEYEASLKAAEARLQDVKTRRTKLAHEEAALLKVVEGWEAIIALERAPAEGEIAMSVVAPLEIQVSDTIYVADSVHFGNEEEEGENKTKFVRDVIQTRANQGTTAIDLKNAAKKAGLNHPPSWPYSVIQRLKKKGEIIKRRGKFYPKQGALSLVQASAS